MKKYFDTVITGTGQPAIGVSVQVNNYPSLTAATIYSDNGVTPKTNPITTDATGYFEFYVADGRYQITISGTGIVTRQINDVVIEDYADMTGPLTITSNSSSPALNITQTGTGNALVVAGNAGIGGSPKTRLQVTAAANLNAPVLGSATNAPFYVTNSDSNYGLLVGINAANGSAWMQVQRTDGTATAYDIRLQQEGGNTLHVGSNGGLGYGTGAGGTVNQTGGRTTGVTLSKPTGSITLVSAAGSTSWQSFTVTNTVVSADDVIKVCQKSGADKYMIHVTNVATGSFQITFATTGGTTTEQPVFSFAVIKGATA